MSLALLGGGGHASDVLSVIEALAADATATAADLYPVFVADDGWPAPHRFQERSGVTMVDSIEAGARMAPFLVTVGYPEGRRAVHDVAEAAGISAPAIVHPHASVGTGVRLAEGVVVMGQTWVSALVEIGRHTHVGYGVTIGHDTELGAFCSIMPGASIAGDADIGDDVLVGANATVFQGLGIGPGAVIGAGAVVTRDVEAGTTVVGTPASPIPRSS